jgi:hypothetical protein
MRDARHVIITCCQVRSRQDTHWRERIRLAFSKRLPQVELVVHVVTRIRLSGRYRPGSRRSGGAGTGSSSACA